ncbi:MAG: hypothetical protein ACRC5R_06120, partial [Mycoplasmatales bacterium]
EENSFILDNGDLLEFNDGVPSVSRQINQGNSMFVSGNNINVSLKDGTMEKLASDGILIFTAIYDSERNLISYPQTITRGFVVINESLPLLKKIQSTFLEFYHKNKRLSDDELQEILSLKMSEFILAETNKFPLVTTKLVKYNPKSFDKILKDHEEKLTKNAK